MSQPYMSGPHIVEGYGGEEVRVELRVPHRGIIRGVRFEQVTGVDAACEFELYNSRKAAPSSPALSSSSGASFPAEGLSESLTEATEGARAAYSVFGAKNMSSGTPFAEYDVNYMYTNRDGTPTNPQRKLYLALRAGGAGFKQYAITLIIETAILS